MLATAILNSENTNFNDIPAKFGYQFTHCKIVSGIPLCFHLKSNLNQYADRDTLKTLQKGGRKKGETTGCAQSWIVEKAQ